MGSRESDYYETFADAEKALHLDYERDCAENDFAYENGLPKE